MKRKQLEDKIKELENRITELERRPIYLPYPIYPQQDITSKPFEILPPTWTN